jgi:CRISPR system Cascade subunit CasE
MYLSRLLLNPRNRAVQNDLVDCQHLHRTILRAFPQVNNTNSVRTQLGILYRLEQSQQNTGLTLLVQSQTLPSWENLPQNYLLETSNLPNPACKSVEEAYQNLKLGMRLIFRLRANPTRKIASPSVDGKKSNGKRVEFQKEEDQILWLKRKAALGGFKLLSLKLNTDISSLQTQAVSKVYGFKKDHKLSFGAVLFQGELEITDLEVFKQTLLNGIGSGKSYGFGLLSIANPNTY